MEQGPITVHGGQEEAPKESMAPAVAQDQVTMKEKVPAPLPAKAPFSWLKPHPVFVILLVGVEKRPFGIQKDFLCDQSEYFRRYFAERDNDEKLEHVVELPEASIEIFGLAQNFMFTGEVITKADIPSYEGLVGLWMLGHKLEIEGLCHKALDAMIECRRTSQRIPATPLLIQVWKETPEGSSIRTLLLSWAAEYMRSSDARTEFAKSLPQEVLSELVVTMSAFDTTHRAAAAPPTDLPPPPSSSTATVLQVSAGMLRKNIHYLEEPSDEETMAAKRFRMSGRAPGELSVGGAGTGDKATPDRRASKSSQPKAQKRRSGAVHFDSRNFSSNQKLNFCADLLARMLSGPGFWTRLVGPFRDPVDPTQDGVPDYLNKVKRPMDLSTMKTKMDLREYKDDEEFLADMRQIFDNCFTYWKKGDPMWSAGEKLQRTFEDKFLGMNKWITKMEGEEGE